MKMNFTDFLYDVFTVKCYETKSYVERNKREGAQEETGLVANLYKTSVSKIKRKKKDGILS